MNIYDLIQIISSVIIVLVALAGGAWTLFKFLRLREVKKALNLQISANVFHRDKSILLDVTIELINVGTVPILITEKEIEHCLFEIRRLPPEKETAHYEWHDQKLEPVLPSIKYLADYQAWARDKDPIILEPSVPCEVHGHVLLQIQNEKIVLLRANLVDSAGILWRTQKLVNLEHSFHQGIDNSL